jgi:hypothetical protein
VISGDKTWTWDQWRELDPENAAFYFTVAGVYLAALEDAGLVVVSKEPTRNASSGRCAE